MTKRFSTPEVTALQTSIRSTLAYVFGENTPEFQRYSSAATLDNGPIMMAGPWKRGHTDEVAEAQRYLKEGIANAAALLEQAVRTLEEELEFEPAAVAAAVEPSAEPQRDGPQKVFVVHGHDEGAKHQLARFLDQIGLEPIILQERPDQGRTIIEKFVDCAADVSFAVILMTADDIGSGVGDEAQVSRARQNVLFELGYFVAGLGRGRVCVLREEQVEIPSDLYGVIYTPLDDAGAWRFKLGQELKAAGLNFDANRLWV